MLYSIKKLSKRKTTLVLVLQLVIFSSFLMPAAGQTFLKKDVEPPSVNITSPSFCSGTLAVGTITIFGTADDSSGINRVEAFARQIEQNEDEFPFQPATPIAPGDWSKWSIQISIPNDKPHWILVRAIDNFGNENWDESMINSERAKMSVAAHEDASGKSRIAFVEPTFTNGAYNEDSFYFFYSKYQKFPDNQSITTDLNLMTGDIPFETKVDYVQPIIDRVKQTVPDSIVSVIGDEEINDGLIFRNAGVNAYDLLVMLHVEYVTQTEYDNLIKFLNNGGSIILLTGNVFYGEVLYDKQDCTVTLKKGHDWEFDGSAVRKSQSERYLEENSKWFGSNFVVSHIDDGVIFERNPFDYEHFEENEVTNKEVVILLDYKAKFANIPSAETHPLVVGGLLKGDSEPETTYSDEGKKIATYELSSGAGKVIQMGIYSQNLVSTEKFLNYFDKIIIPRAIGNTYHFVDDDGEFDLFWNLQDGQLSDVKLDKESKTLSLKVERETTVNSETEEDFSIILPKQLIDSVTSNKMTDFIITVNGVNVPYTQSADDIERGLAFPVPDSAEINIIGTSVVPEFGQAEIIMIVFLVAIGFSIMMKSGTHFRILKLKLNF